ncbi:MAG: hypothetical protein GY820_20015 [Gammaproteobacteria bacterium]|nr:hypothetical protein [Gammaproteobacteria bacterium]
MVPHSKGVPGGGAGTTDRALMASGVPAPFLTGCEKEETLCSCGCGISCPTSAQLKMLPAKPTAPAIKPYMDRTEPFSVQSLCHFLKEKKVPKQGGCKKCWGCEVATRYGFSFGRWVIVVVLKVVFVIFRSYYLVGRGQPPI